MNRRNFLGTGLGGLSLLALKPAEALAQVEQHPLETQIEEYIAQLRRHGDIRETTRTAWKVYDLFSGSELVTINEDQEMQARSPVFVPILALAYFHEVNAGNIPSSEQLDNTIFSSMIYGGDEPYPENFTTPEQRVTSLLGGLGEVNRIIRENYGGVFVQAEIQENQPWRVSAHDLSRFLYAFYHEELGLSPELQAQFAEIMQSTVLASRLSDDFSTRPIDTEETYGVFGHGSASVLVKAQARTGRTFPYIFVGIINTEWDFLHFEETDLIRAVSEMVYEHQQRIYGLVDL